MKAETLRKSILQLAVEGKLVPQDETEEPASELLKKIQTEKEELIKEGKIKRNKKESVIFRKDGSFYEQVGKKEPVCIDDEIPFEIPDSWEWCRLGSLISVKSGEGLVKKDFKNGEIPVYGGNGITGYHDESNVQANTILIGRVGFYCGSIHKTKIDSWVTDNALIVTKPSDIYIDFMIIFLKAMDLGKNTNQTAQPVISGKKIKPRLFPLPPFSEQKRIVEKIEELTPYIEKYDETEQELSKLNEEISDKMRKSILQYTVEGKLVEQDETAEPASELLKKIQTEKEELIKEGKIKRNKKESVIFRKDGSFYEQVGKKEPVCIDDEIPFEIPDSWEWVRFGSLVEFPLGKTPPRKESEYWTNANYNWVSIADMEDGKHIKTTKEYVNDVAKENIFKNRISPKGTLLMSFKLTVGKVSILDIDAFHNEAIISIYPYYDVNNITRNYLFYTLPLLSQEGDTKSAIKGKTLNKTSLNALFIPLPSMSEQKRIVEKLQEVLSIVERFDI